MAHSDRRESRYRVGEGAPRFQTKAHYAADSLKAAIRLGELGPGERLDIESLADDMNMSPTPVREALRLLEAEGIVEYEPHRGARVAGFPNDQIEELFQLRALLEGAAIRLAVPRMGREVLEELRALEGQRVRALRAGDRATSSRLNERWHMAIYQAAMSTPFLSEFISRLWTAFPWTTSWRVPGRAETSISEHSALLAAVESGDAELAGRLMEEHVLSNRSAVLGMLERLDQDDSRRAV